MDGSLTQWTWVWASSRGWWWTEEPEVLQSMGSQRVRHDWVTELKADLNSCVNSRCTATWFSWMCMHVLSHCHFWLFMAQWTVACESPLSMAFCRPEYWSGLPFPPPGVLLHPGIELGCPVYCISRQSLLRKHFLNAEN